MSEAMVTAAEIADQLGVEAGGSRTVRLLVPLAPEPAGPLPDAAERRRFVRWLAWAVPAAGLAWLANQVDLEEPLTAAILSLAAVAGTVWLFGSYQPGSSKEQGAYLGQDGDLWLQPPALPEPVEPPLAPTVLSHATLTAAPTHLTIRYGDGVEEPHGWSEVEAADVPRRAYLVVVAGRECYLPQTPEAQAIYRTAKMLRVRRARAGEQGLAFVDEAGDAALSRMSSDEADIERGLSVSEGEG